MNSLERLRRKIQIALVIEAHRPSGAIPEVVELAKRYSIHGDEAHIRSSIKRWENQGYLITYKRLDGAVGARIRPDSLSDALSEVLDFLDADTFRVDWKKEQIITDAADQSLIACPDGWFIFEIERNQSSKPPASRSVDGVAVAPVHIVNNFTPANSFAPSIPPAKTSISWSGWVGVFATIAGIIVAIWLAGRL